MLNTVEVKGFLRNRLAVLSEELGKELANVVPGEFDSEVRQAADKELDKLQKIYQVIFFRRFDSFSKLHRFFLFFRLWSQL